MGWFWYNSKPNRTYISTNNQSVTKMFPASIFRHWPVRPCFYNLDLCDACSRPRRLVCPTRQVYNTSCRKHHLGRRSKGHDATLENMARYLRTILEILLHQNYFNLLVKR